MLSIEDACKSFAAVGSEPRMKVLLTLVQAGDDGLLFREIGERTGIPASTLSHHLKFLTAAQLVTQKKQGRETISTPNFARLELLSGYILATCCADVPDRGTPC